jgi:hypothetical protein
MNIIWFAYYGFRHSSGAAAAGASKAPSIAYSPAAAFVAMATVSV